MSWEQEVKEIERRRYLAQQQGGEGDGCVELAALVSIQLVLLNFGCEQCILG